MLFVESNVNMFMFKDKKYIYNCPAYQFIEKTEKTLARNDISKDIPKKIVDILDGLRENDNNILMWGEMK